MKCYCWLTKDSTSKHWTPQKFWNQFQNYKYYAGNGGRLCYTSLFYEKLFLKIVGSKSVESLKTEERVNFSGTCNGISTVLDDVTLWMMSLFSFKARVFGYFANISLFEKFCCEHKNTNVRIIHGFEHMASRWVKCGVEGWVE